MADGDEAVELGELRDAEESDARRAERPLQKAKMSGLVWDSHVMRVARTPVACVILLAVAMFFAIGVRLGRFMAAAMPSLYSSPQPLQRLKGRADWRGDELPFYDIVIMIYMTASQEDTSRLHEASQSWLARPDVSGLSFTYIGIVCADDPDVVRLFGNEHIGIVGCRHGYKTLVTKGIEGYRYVSEHYNFDYVLKTDIDTVVPLECVVDSLSRIDRVKCPSFGMGSWYPARTSEVWLSGDYPHGPKFGNDAYAEETGNDFYNPYMSGWAIIFSADVARFLGMNGLGDYAPRWRRTWTVDDAAIGTFLVGLDMCQLPMQCTLASDLKASELKGRSKAIGDGESALPVDSEQSITGFSGPYDDDVPGVGDLANVQASSLGNCAARCLALERCRSFEFSKTATATGFVRNCQLASNAMVSGAKYGDFELYLRD